MIETLNRPEHPEHFEVSHENGELLMCMSSGGECRILVQVMDGYSPEEEQQIIASTTAALQAIDQFTGGKTTDVFSGLHIKIGEGVAEDNADTTVEENQIVLSGGHLLFSVAEIRRADGSYDDRLVGFPDENQPGGILEYALVHEIGQILGEQTQSGEARNWTAIDEEPTEHGRETDQRHGNSKDHEEFADNFAHAVWGMPISKTAESAVRDRLSKRLQELADNQVLVPPELIKSIDGVEYKQLFSAEKQREVLRIIGEWFRNNNHNFPEGGIVFDANRSNSSQSIAIEEVPGVDGNLSGIKVPPEILTLFYRILQDSLQDPLLAKRDARFIVERTGTTTHGEDSTFHVDTKQIYWDEAGNRVGYDSARSSAKYMVYVGRPGTVIIHDKVDGQLTHQQATTLALQQSLDAEGRTLTKEEGQEPVVSQLLPNAIYKVAVGELIHSPPIHEDGLMITALFNK